MEMTTKHFSKTQKHLRTSVWEAWQQYALIEENDRVMVCLSGGKDSYTLLDILLHFQKESSISFDIVAVNLDQKQPGYPEDVLPNYLKNLGVKYKVVERNTYDIVISKIEPGKTMCSLCSRLRRGNLYTIATEIGATKIALGHHREDILETFFMNLFNGGRLEAMPPKFLTDDKKHTVIRPLAFCKESEIEIFAQFKKFPIIPCNLCGSQENMMRKNVKMMLKEWEKENPGRLSSIFTALQNVHPSHLLDPKLFDFSMNPTFPAIFQEE
jgi:tRNA 2-thiocytidine biosynthesis protein TtcA